MLIHKESNILIATPTKVGSESLEKDLIGYGKVVRVRQVGKHAVNSPFDKVVKERWLLIRHPLERFSSIYHFIGRNKRIVDTSGLFDAARKKDINLFCERYLFAKRSVWTIQLDEYVKKFKPTRVFKLEEDGLNNILREFGIENEASHINKTVTNSGFKNLKKHISEENLYHILQLHKQSLKLYGKEATV